MAMDKQDGQRRRWFKRQAKILRGMSDACSLLSQDEIRYEKRLEKLIETLDDARYMMDLIVSDYPWICMTEHEKACYEAAEMAMGTTTESPRFEAYLNRSEDKLSNDEAAMLPTLQPIFDRLAAEDALDAADEDDD